ncbi:hypothetical protein DFH11DRAFT_1199323 [Phellopilus nigrolimitatus]|nr:hypothetical protein DFH11DRAFT_1199323 [Phellopilus nigrolimitatus]
MSMEGLADKKDSLETLLPTAEVPRSRVHGASPRRKKISTLARAVLLCLCLAGLLVSSNSLLGSYKRAGGVSVDSLWSALEGAAVFNHAGPSHTEALCPQVEQLLPERNKALWDAVGDQFGTDAFKEKAVDWLGGAVRVPTESYDDMDPVGIDPRWTKFQAFHDYLLEAFPLVHSSLKLIKVNTYGLIYEWAGSDSSLKPLLLTAHQDVVPVDPRTVDEWAHPPFSGFFDGARIWGRGSSDDKSGLIGVMSATETLLGAKFQPTRKIVLAFGFDEEVSGLYGAYELGKHLEATYGKDAFAMVVDEGGGFSEQYGGVFAVPAVGEKGYFDTLLEVLSPGGHSSVPPVHTSIGILSALLVEYETHPIPAFLDRTTPFYGMLQCFAAHAPDMDSKLRKTVQQSASSDKALHELEKVIAKDKALRALVGTTQAIDLIQGGVKANALPEQAWAIVNHRIASQRYEARSRRPRSMIPSSWSNSPRNST